jgi:hypothetical protein
MKRKGFEFLVTLNRNDEEEMFEKLRKDDIPFRGLNSYSKGTVSFQCPQTGEDIYEATNSLISNLTGMGYVVQEIRYIGILSREEESIYY